MSNPNVNKQEKNMYKCMHMYQTLYLF